MAISYNEEKYRFTFREFCNAYPLNPEAHEASMLFISQKQMLSIVGPANEDFTGFADGVRLEEMTVNIYPENPDKIWTEASINWLRIIPCGAEDDIRIKEVGMTFPKKIDEILKEDRHSPVMKRALIGVKEADKTIRETFPGYCLTETKIE